MLTPVMALAAVAILTGIGIAIDHWSAGEDDQTQIESIAQSQTPGSGNVPEIDSVPTTEAVFQTAPAPAITPRSAPTISYEDDDSDDHEREYDDD